MTISARLPANKVEIRPKPFWIGRASKQQALLGQGPGQRVEPIAVADVVRAFDQGQNLHHALLGDRRS